MKIEILYPELCNLYGDRGNITYLKSCLPKAKFIETNLQDIPCFIDEKVTMIYMGSMSEKNQERALNKLKKYKERIQQLIEQDVIFLLVGNSFEIFTNYIETETGAKIEGLGLLNFYTKRFIPKRFNALFLGMFEKNKIVGYTSRFTHTYGDNSQNYLFKVEKGLGLNEESELEGIHIHNLFATYMLGPLLIQNPLFTKYLLSLMNSKQLAFKNSIMEAYETRVNEFEKKLK